MQKKLTAAIVAGAIVIGGGAAIAVPAFADSSSSGSSGSSGSTTQAGPQTSREDAIKNSLKALVDAGTITQDQADKVAAALAKPGALGPGAGAGRPGGHGPGGTGSEGPGGRGGMGLHGLIGDEAQAASTFLGLSVDDIRTALKGGSTLADLAKKQNKSETDLINALVDVAKTNIAKAVTDKRLTQDQADKIEANLPDRVKSIVENGRPGFGKGGPASTTSFQRSA